MNTSENLISIIQASKQLGINRSTLNRFINEFDIPKTKKGRVALVDYSSIQTMVQQLAAKGRIRTPNGKKQIKTSSEPDQNHLIKHYRTELDRLLEYRKELEDKNKNILFELNTTKEENKELKEKNDIMGEQLRLIEGKVEKIKKGSVSNFFHRIGL